MELPKNVTQIGEVSRDCKVYVEDYVISYMKQMNRLAMDKETAVALYGRRREENGVVYYFLYGACKAASLQREVRHLSQAQKQEIESLRRKYFPEYIFVGYRLLNGEMVEGFHICEQEICRYIPGYAQFYEKNDSMLAYMLVERDEAKPEQVDQGKYEEVKRRQEERRAASSRPAKIRRGSSRARAGEKADVRHRPAAGRMQGMRTAAVAVFALLCLAGVAAMRGNANRQGINDLQASAKQWFSEIKGSQADMPSEEDVVAANAQIRKDTLVLEDKLDQALLEENSRFQPTTVTPDPQISEPAAESSSPEETYVPGQEAAEPESTPEPTPFEPVPEPAEEPPAVETVQTPKAVAYVVQHGDTLTAISWRQYGNGSRVLEICALNSISDPDDIKEGQVIMLPR